MKSKDARRALSEITASQWGLVTTSQASALGVSRLYLQRLTEAGDLARVSHGVYRSAGAPASQHERLRAAWLSTDPKRLGEDRVGDRQRGVVVAGASAARLHEVGDLWSDRHEFVAPVRKQTQRAEIRFRLRRLDPKDVTLVEGLPVMTLERTIADLLEEVSDLSLVADALSDARQSPRLDLGRLQELLSPLAARHGLGKNNGEALLARLLELA